MTYAHLPTVQSLFIKQLLVTCVDSHNPHPVNLNPQEQTCLHSPPNQQYRYPNRNALKKTGITHEAQATDRALH